MRIIDADKLGERKFHDLSDHLVYKKGWNDAIDAIMMCEPDISIEDFQPLINKLLEVAPVFVDAIVNNMPAFIDKYIESITSIKEKNNED